jgi:hypothetical protein
VVLSGVKTIKNKPSSRNLMEHTLLEASVSAITVGALLFAYIRRVKKKLQSRILRDYMLKIERT